jgi:ABC-2 type transport system permease protein
MVSGTLFRTPEQASAIGPAVGIAFGMLGGCMWPLEIVPESVRLAGHFTPHAWAVDAWVTLLSRGGGLVDIAGYLAILATYAAVLLAIATLLCFVKQLWPCFQVGGRGRGRRSGQGSV